MIIHHFNRTKIVATIGPATSDVNMIEQLVLSGVDVCRINSSHGDHAMMKSIIDNVHAVNEKMQAHVAVLLDLQGPKIRIGDLKDGEFELKEGDELTLTTENVPGTRDLLFIKYPGFVNDVKSGDRILIDDGKLELEVMKIISSDRVLTRVLHGGILSSRKGVNLPNTKISLPSLTEKDEADLEFALSAGVEWIGLSFVRKADDVRQLKEIIKSRKLYTRVIAKIEKPEAIENIDEIISVSDGIMVARGDLGVELPMQKVPVIQKLIVKKCNAAGKPVIIATQMMESMINNYAPTRAEVNDVGNAVFDGADALMLSGETSVGKYPLEVVRSMQKIITEVEQQPEIFYREAEPQKNSNSFLSDSISYNACVMARQVGATAIAAMTHSGMTAFKVSAHRPKAHIFIFTDNRPMLKILNLVWGVRGFYYDKYESTDTTIKDVRAFLVENNMVQQGDFMIHVASTPLQEKATSNTIKLTRID